MAAPFDQHLVCPLLIGRAPQLAALHQMVDVAKNGRGQVALIAGEAGIGKSRLASEAAAYAAAQGFHVLAGHCFPPDRASPYALIVDLLHSQFTLASLPPHADALDSDMRELMQLLPELAPVASNAEPLDPESHKRRLFTALEHYMFHLAARQPLLLLLEDLHWSDEASLECVHSLARHSGSHALLLLLTYRSDELHVALTHLLAQLDRERRAAEFALPPLTHNEVGEMLHAMFELQHPVRNEFLSAIYELTEGNPFFIEEVLKSLVAAGDIFRGDQGWSRKPLRDLRIPRTVHDTVRQRVERLSAPAQQVLQLAAVAGRRFDFTLLQHVTQYSEDELLHIMKELIAAQLIVEETAERFAFRHALIRQAIYTTLLARERRTLHRTMAETIERMDADAIAAHMGDLAYHFYEAEVWAKALWYAQQAGEHAYAMYAPQAAVEQLSRAVEAAREMHVTPPLACYRVRGLAYEMLGNFDQARADHETALNIARTMADQPAAWQALLDLGMLWAGHDYMQTGAYYQSALDVARSLGNPAMLAQSLNRLGNWHANIEHPHEALRCHQEAIAIFEASNDERGLAETLDLLGMTSELGGDAVQSAAYYDQVVPLFQQLDDRQGLSSSLVVRALQSGAYWFETMVPAARNMSDAIREAEWGLQIAREIGWRAGEAFALFESAALYGPQGEYGGALDLALASLAIAEEIEHHQWRTLAHTTVGVLHLELLARASAREHLEQALALAQAINSQVMIRITAGYLAATCIQQHELSQAEAVLNDVLRSDTPMQTMGQRLAWYARAELTLAQHDPDLALQITDQLIATASNLSPMRIIPRLWKLRGETLMALGRITEAEPVLHAARDGAEAAGARPLLWRIHVALGRLYRASNRHGEATAAFATAQSLIDQLAATISDEALQSNFLQQATSMLPRPRPSTPRQAAREAFGGLTSRERDVARLVAQGKSNREVAETLVLSERTVEDHVSHILAKLGFAGRVQIAAWAIAHGLEMGSE